jgi:flagellar motor switch protein FliG
MRRATEDSVFADLTEHAPEIAERIGRHRFTFSDLLALDGKSLQRVLRDVDADTLRLAMKGLDVEQQQILFSNMSERGAARLREDLENTGPTRLREVEGAQQSMVARARGLADQGEIQLSMGSSEGEEEEALV